MTRKELDTLWQQALHQSVIDGDIYARYRFAQMVAQHERELCAKVCEDNYDSSALECSIEIRQRGEQCSQQP